MLWLVEGTVDSFCPLPHRTQLPTRARRRERGGQPVLPSVIRGLRGAELLLSPGSALGQPQSVRVS